MRSLSDVLLAAAAIAFGMFTWSIAHVLSYVLFAHTHVGTVSYTHVDDGVGPILVATLAFVATSLGAVRAGADGSRTARRIFRARPGALAAACAPSAFVLVELLHHSVSGGDGPPVALLVGGIVLHSATGAVTPMLWSRLVRRVVVVWSVVGFVADESESERRAETQDQGWASARALSRITNRGPPAVGFTLFTVLSGPLHSRS